MSSAALKTSAETQSADTPKVVWVASMPRSGSMWAYNVTRAVLRHGDFTVMPESIPQSKNHTLAIAEEGLKDDDPAKVWAVKVHEVIRADLPRSSYIATHRDPRDALISYKRFMRCDFDFALRAMTGSAALCDYYLRFPDKLCLNVRYEDILAQPSNVVCRIAAHIGVALDEAAASQIVDEFSKAKVGQRITKAEQRIQRLAEAGQPVDRREIVALGAQNHRVMDIQTGFQSGHVSNYRDGGWRESLTADELQKVHDALGNWLARHGYPETLPST